MLQGLMTPTLSPFGNRLHLIPDLGPGCRRHVVLGRKDADILTVIRHSKLRRFTRFHSSEQSHIAAGCNERACSTHALNRGVLAIELARMMDQLYSAICL